ncbi:hypothetical protein N8198_06345 [Gammaproteobacteria bacterium]|nr:hypothetical protein [Gammaproteobacteria bacterium]
MNIYRKLARRFAMALFASLVLSLSGCSDPQVYGSVGVSSGYGGYHGGGYYGGGPRMRTSISVGGRIR